MGKARDAYEAGATLRDLAARYKLAPSTIALKLRREGVKLRPRGRPRKVTKA